MLRLGVLALGASLLSTLSAAARSSVAHDALHVSEIEVLARGHDVAYVPALEAGRLRAPEIWKLLEEAVSKGDPVALLSASRLSEPLARTAVKAYLSGR